MQIKSLSLLAGAALGLSGSLALAQTQSTDEVKAVVSEMMSDAETRSSLLAGGDAGNDGRFFIAGDGFRLNVGGLLQFRYTFNFRDDDSVTPANPDDFTHGFNDARTKVDFSGELNKDWFFRVRLNASDAHGDDQSSSSGVFVDYAYAGYKFANGLKLTWGQFKTALLREELISDAKQLAVERSIVNKIFSQGYSQGVELAWEAETWRWFFDVTDGLNSANTDWNNLGTVSPAQPLLVSGQAEFAITGRLEFLFSGNWKQMEDFTAQKGGDGAFMLGVAGHYQQSTNTPQIQDIDQNFFEYTADASFKGDGWNLYGAFVGRFTQLRSGAISGMLDEDFNDFGIVFQGGYRFTEMTEVFARYDVYIPDSDLNDIEDTYNFISFGVNEYFAGHAAKFTAQLVWALEATDSLFATGAIPSTLNGLLGSSDENEIAIQLQMQIVF